eukprot:827013-Pelagomonas_calceolata.AAC.6
MLPLPAVAAACAAAVLRLLLLQGAASALPPAAAAAAAEVSCAVRWPRGEWGAMPGSPLSVYESDAEAEGRGDPRPSSPICGCFTRACAQPSQQVHQNAACLFANIAQIKEHEMEDVNGLLSSVKLDSTPRPTTQYSCGLSTSSSPGGRA